MPSMYIILRKSVKLSRDALIFFYFSPLIRVSNPLDVTPTKGSSNDINRSNLPQNPLWRGESGRDGVCYFGER